MSNVELDLGPVWWSFGSGSSPRHISLGAGAPPNSPGGGVASAIVIEELEPFLALHAGATNASFMAPTPAQRTGSPPQKALPNKALVYTLHEAEYTGSIQHFF